MKRIKTVLVVDDDAEYVSFMCKAIGSAYPVASASDGEKAILKARIVKPDVIVLDVMMPGGMDGFTTFCSLRKDSETCKIPVIMLSEVARKTGLPFEGKSMEQYLGSAPTAFLEKPVSAEKLLNEVKKALNEESSDQKGVRLEK